VTQTTARSSCQGTHVRRASRPPATPPATPCVTPADAARADGFHKAVCELMINDYSRRSWVDGRGLRLPVIVVRPGAPNAALTGAWSSVVREPLNGEDVVLPLPLEVKMPVASYQTVVSAIATLLNDVPTSELGADRTLMLPSISASCAEMYAAAGRVAAERGIKLGRAVAEPQEVATRIVTGMGERSDGRRGLALGLPQDASPDEIVNAYAADGHIREKQPFRGFGT
jgi:nucleoside-diphosphate-sugar epimerase